MNQVAALFCRSDSNYRLLPGVDVFDLARDARSFAVGQCFKPFHVEDVVHSRPCAVVVL